MTDASETRAAEGDELRARAREVIEKEGKSQKACSLEAGVAYATFSAWLNGTYAGDNDKVGTQIRKWLDGREALRETAIQAAAGEPGFVATPTAKAITAILQYGHATPDMVVIAGGPGIGKTSTIQAYRANAANVWVATAQPCISGVNHILVELCEVLGVAEARAIKMSRAIGNRVRNARGLIVIDDAQHLTSAAIDQLRSLYDLYGVGIALVGNEQIYARLEGEGRKPAFAQLFSRIGMRMRRAKPAAGDAEMLIEAWGVADKADVAFCREIARKPGALRGLTKTLRLASVLAAGEDAPRGARHLQAAWGRLSSTNDSGE